MTRFLLFIFLLFLLYTVLHYLIKGVLVYRKISGKESGPEELVQDPYCQTYIPRRTAVKKRIAGRMLYFCNQECLKNYLRRDKNDR
jgi:YHS domain-containing protein